MNNVPGLEIDRVRRRMQERGEELGPGGVAGAEDVGVRVHGVAERVPGARRPRGGRQGQEAASPAGTGPARHVLVDRGSCAGAGPHGAAETVSY